MDTSRPITFPDPQEIGGGWRLLVPLAPMDGPPLPRSYAMPLFHYQAWGEALAPLVATLTDEERRRLYAPIVLRHIP
jgi:hypothetical protein